MIQTTPCVIGIQGLEILFLCGAARLNSAQQHASEQRKGGCRNRDARPCQFLKPENERGEKKTLATFGFPDSSPDRAVKITVRFRSRLPALQKPGEIVAA